MTSLGRSLAASKRLRCSLSSSSAANSAGAASIIALSRPPRCWPAASSSGVDADDAVATAPDAAVGTEAAAADDGLGGAAAGLVARAVRRVRRADGAATANSICAARSLSVRVAWWSGV